MDRKELKENARKSLVGKYFETFKMFLFIALISAVAGFVASLLDQALHTSWVIDSQKVLGQVVETKFELFNTIATILCTCAFAFGIESYFLKISRNEEVTYKESYAKTNMFAFYFGLSFVVGLFTALWSILFIIPGIIAAISYTFVYNIKLDNPELSVMECIAKSKELMNGHKMEYFILQLSFLGWAILGVFTLGILYLWLVPYMSVTMCNFYNKLANK